MTQWVMELRGIEETSESQKMSVATKCAVEQNQTCTVTEYTGWVDVCNKSSKSVTTEAVTVGIATCIICPFCFNFFPNT